VDRERETYLAFRGFDGVHRMTRTSPWRHGTESMTWLNDHNDPAHAMMRDFINQIGDVVHVAGFYAG